MSERWGSCRRCEGKGLVELAPMPAPGVPAQPHALTSMIVECPRCEGTGFDGSISAYDEMQEARRTEEFTDKGDPI